MWSPGMSPSLGTSRQAFQRDPCSKRVLSPPWGWNCPGSAGRAFSAEETLSVKTGSPRLCVVLLEHRGQGWRAVSLSGAQSWCQATACLCSGGGGGAQDSSCRQRGPHGSSGARSGLRASLLTLKDRKWAPCSQRTTGLREEGILEFPGAHCRPGCLLEEALSCCCIL